MHKTSTADFSRQSSPSSIKDNLKGIGALIILFAPTIMAFCLDGKIGMSILSINTLVLGMVISED